MSEFARNAVVTGVSTGIGWGTVKVLTANGFRVFGSVRKQADADRLAAEFGDAFAPLLFDVTDEAGVREGAAKVREVLGGRTLDGLVNNAGIAVGGPLLHLPLDELRKQLEVNLTGVLIATQAFAPLLGADRELRGKPGRIVNIGSVGGKSAFPFMAPYHVTKYGLEGFTESLRRELLLYGIDATLVAPGSVATAIWDKAEQADYSAYDNTDYKVSLDAVMKEMMATGKKGLPPEKIGEAILHQLTASNPPTYKVVTPDPGQFFALRFLPKRMVDKTIGKRLKLLRKA